MRSDRRRRHSPESGLEATTFFGNTLFRQRSKTKRNPIQRLAHCPNLVPAPAAMQDPPVIFSSVANPHREILVTSFRLPTSKTLTRLAHLAP